MFNVRVSERLLTPWIMTAGSVNDHTVLIVCRTAAHVTPFFDRHTIKLIYVSINSASIRCHLRSEYFIDLPFGWSTTHLLLITVAQKLNG